MKRHRDALFIQDPGACNPSGIAHSIVDACRECRDNGVTDTAAIRADPAIRLMVHQLAFICGLACDFPAVEGRDGYTVAVDACKAASEPATTSVETVS